MLVSTSLARSAALKRIGVRRVFGRRLEQTGEHGGFGQIDVAHRLAEIELGCRLNAHGAAAQIGAVEIELEDFVLAEARLKPERQIGFLDLAVEGALGIEKDVLGELLGQRAAALDHHVGAGVGDHGAGGADDVHAEMFEEPPVFGGQHGLDQMIGDLLQRHSVRTEHAALADFVAVSVEERDAVFAGRAPRRVIGGLDGVQCRTPEATKSPAIPM